MGKKEQVKRVCLRVEYCLKFNIEDILALLGFSVKHIWAYEVLEGMYES